MLASTCLVLKRRSAQWSERCPVSLSVMRPRRRQGGVVHFAKFRPDAAGALPWKRSCGQHRAAAMRANHPGVTRYLAPSGQEMLPGAVCPDRRVNGDRTRLTCRVPPQGARRASARNDSSVSRVHAALTGLFGQTYRVSCCRFGILLASVRIAREIGISRMNPRGDVAVVWGQMPGTAFRSSVSCGDGQTRLASCRRHRPKDRARSIASTPVAEPVWST